MKPSNETIARTVCLCVALLNQALAIFGKDKLPFAEDDIYQFCTLLLTSITSVVTWWKNNSFTAEARMADEYMRSLKGKG